MILDSLSYPYCDLEPTRLNQAIVFAQQSLCINKERAEKFVIVIVKEVSKLLKDIPFFDRPPERVYSVERFYGCVTLLSSILSLAIYFKGLQSAERAKDEDLSKNKTVKDAAFFISCVILAIKIYQAIAGRKIYTLQEDTNKIKIEISKHLLPYFDHSEDIAKRWILLAAKEMHNVLLDEKLEWSLDLADDEEEIAVILFNTYRQEPSRFKGFKNIDEQNYYQMARGLAKGLVIYTKQQ